MKRILSLILSLGLLFQQVGFAQVAGELNISSYLSGIGNNLIQEKFRPMHLRYFSYDNLNDNFKVILDKGDIKQPEAGKTQETTKTLLSYFLIGVTLPDDMFWVNLRPDTADQIIDPYLEKTDIGKIMLEADLQLKKDTALYTSPQSPEGRQYWNRLYKKAGEIFGNENMEIPTLTRPWIVPGEIIIRETQENAYVYKATLKVMLEQDYLKDSTTYNFTDERSKKLNEYASKLIRETIIPKLTKDINTAKRYAPLRQVYYSLILAHWFKDKFSGKGGLYSQLINKKNLNGLVSKESWSKDTYFQAYQKSFKEGEYNIKESVYTLQGQTIRNYMSGGIAIGYDAIKRAISSGIEILGNSLRPLVTLNHQIAGNLSPGSIQDPFSGEVNIQPQEPIGSPTIYSPVTVEEVNYDSGDNSNRALFIKIHKGPFISTGTWGRSSEVLKTYGAANCIVSLLIDNEAQQGIMGHYPYIVSKYSSKDLNVGFHSYLDVVKGITSVNTRYTLYLFGGSPVSHSEADINMAREAKKAVRDAFNDALGGHIDNVVDKTAAGFETIDWLIADIKNKDITYHYTSASSPVVKVSEGATWLKNKIRQVILSGEKNAGTNTSETVRIDTDQIRLPATKEIWVTNNTPFQIKDFTVKKNGLAHISIKLDQAT